MQEDGNCTNSPVLSPLRAPLARKKNPSAVYYSGNVGQFFSSGTFRSSGTAVEWTSSFSLCTGSIRINPPVVRSAKILQVPIPKLWFWHQPVSGCKTRQRGTATFRVLGNCRVGVVILDVHQLSVPGTRWLVTEYGPIVRVWVA
jgi:hypothetical protein